MPSPQRVAVLLLLALVTSCSAEFSSNDADVVTESSGRDTSGIPFQDRYVGGDKGGTLQLDVTCTINAGAPLELVVSDWNDATVTATPRPGSRPVDCDGKSHHYEVLVEAKADVQVSVRTTDRTKPSDVTFASRATGVAGPP